MSLGRDTLVYSLIAFSVMIMADGELGTLLCCEETALIL